MGLGLGNISSNTRDAKVAHFTKAMHFDGSADFEQAADNNATTLEMQLMFFSQQFLQKDNY